MRWLGLVAGAALVALAFAAATRVADTREGLIAEIVTLLGGMAGVLLLIYGLAGRRPANSPTSTAPQAPEQRPPRLRSRTDLLFGAGGIGLAIVLLSGLSVSGGVWWAGLGAVLLLPLIAGSAYLFVRFLRASR